MFISVTPRPRTYSLWIKIWRLQTPGSNVVCTLNVVVNQFLGIRQMLKEVCCLALASRSAKSETLEKSFLSQFFSCWLNIHEYIYNRRCYKMLFSSFQKFVLHVSGYWKTFFRLLSKRPLSCSSIPSHNCRLN
jgi:hypothetical protein